MKIAFTDLNEEVVDALLMNFSRVDHEKISFSYNYRNVFDLLPTPDIYVIAGNSYGIMTGGIDLAFRKKFGVFLQDAIQEEIFFHRRQSGLAVGEAINVVIPKEYCTVYSIPEPYYKRIIYAPTVVVPGDVSNTENAKWAFFAILNEAHKLQRQKVESLTIACPGLCTFSGKILPKQAADQMYDGFIMFCKEMAINDSRTNY